MDRSISKAVNEKKEEILDLYRPFSNSFRDFAQFEEGRYNEYAFKAQLAFEKGKSLVDLGAGTNAINPLLQLMGMNVSIVDDFGDSGYGNFELDQVLDGVHRAIGVDVYSLDVLHDKLPFKNNSIDVLTTYDALEHFYGNVKHIMEEISRITRPGGKIIIGVPNAANLRKRIASVMGRVQWTSFDEWYYDEPFRGHVREPIVSDLLKLLEVGGYQPVKVIGRNWNLKRVKKFNSLTTVIGKLIELRPTLCSEIYVVGRKL
jgi:SAM-dependent methyltransferase